MPVIKKVLAANRGEIAIRIFRACHDLGLNTVAMYSNEDALNLFRTEADESYLIGENMSPLGAYLDIPSVINLALKHNVDAIHPGYGFMSENSKFARACEEAGVKFIGPPSDVLDKMGDKLNAKKIAKGVGVPTIPGTTVPLKDAKEALEMANSFGFPVILKAAAGGGGKGMRRCDSPAEIESEFALVQSEAAKAFGSGDIFIEKFLLEPKHIEIQILADEHGNVMHLGERDCSLQRRYQKVVEFAPAFSLTKEKRQQLYDDAIKIAKSVGYINAGTIEFLVDGKGDHYFIEMNPRIQVEHTVTEMVTGVDLVRAQILIAAGEKLDHPDIGLNSQDDIVMRGYAIQSRVTTEDPANFFAPDTGKITSYRSGGGCGVRLDGGNAFAGAVISPYYDSLLVKVLAWDNTFTGVCRKSLRAIKELRIRGIKTNIPFITNILSHPTFLAGKCDTKFIDDTPELYSFLAPKDRDVGVLKFIATTQMKNGGSTDKKFEKPQVPEVLRDPGPGLKQLLDEKGPKAVADWVLDQKKLLLSDTTMRDAHQSLFSTRMRTKDMVDAGEAISDILADCFSLEMWGGATFDVAYRFLHEDPWDRLDKLRKKIPNILFGMLLRGSNALGYENYPDNLIREFIKEAAAGGIDVFRIFDSLNWMPAVEVAMDEVIKQGKICQGAVCYTGDITDPKRDKYTLKYYVDFAKGLEKRGAHMLGIKDMSGLIKPYAAKKLISTLKQEIGIPIQLHTHDTSGNQIAAYMYASEAGVDVVDVATASFSSLTSQPAMGSLIAALEGSERDTGFDIERIEKLDEYWANVRLCYESFDSGLKTPMTEIYRYEIPGGQYSNLHPQVVSLGLGNRFEEVKKMYRRVNDMLGDIVKVTPSSKMVGDLAIFMVQNELTPENIVEKGKHLTYPDSVVSYFKGMMGQPAWGFPEDLQKIVLRGEAPITCRPGELLKPVDFDVAREALRKVKNTEPTNRDIVSWFQYPKVVEDYFNHHQEYDQLTDMPSSVFFHGMNPGETTMFDLDDGKTLVIKYIGMGDANDDGTRNFQYELNGMRREVAVVDPSLSSSVKAAQMAEPNNLSHVGAPIPGMLSKINVKVGDKVKENDILAVVEAMKMEINIVAQMDGVIEKVLAEAGSTIVAGELLAVIQ